MKIAEIVAVFPPYPGGMGYVCFHNARELSRRGHEVTVFTLDKGGLSYENDSPFFQIERLKTPLIYGDGGVVPQLYSRLKEFDLIHLHYPFFGGAEYVYLASVLSGKKYFLTYHMDVSGTVFFKTILIDVYTKLLMKSILNKATLIGAVNIPHLQNSRAARLIDWSKVVEIPNGVDADRFSPRDKNNALIRKYGLEDKIVVLFVGNLLPLKGLHLLIDALSLIEDERIVLLVVGGGYSEIEYKKQVIQKGLQQRVIFAGAQSHDGSLPEYYNVCDFLVLPSTSESFGLVVLEAMASGKPAIVSALPGPSQLINDGTDGLLIKTGDREDLKNKIEYLAGNAKICRDMGRAGREKVLAKYSWDRIGAELEKAFISMMDR